MKLPPHPFDWTILHSDYLANKRWIKVRQDRCRMPDGRIIDPYYVLEYPNWINVLALDAAGRVILTRQYRHGIGATVLELPSGSVDPRETPLETARRELLEETGYEFEQLVQTAELSPNPGNHANRVFSFLATGGQKVAEPVFDDSEEIETVLVTMDKFKQLLAENQLVQAMHVSAAFYGLQKLGKYSE
jgi:8-oxo-dGTP pyrophosphatase MutT (NUDIX family)